jgi:hypothetical protein
VGSKLLIHCLAEQLGYVFGDPSCANCCQQVLVEHWDPSKWPSEADDWQNSTPLRNLLGLTHEVLIARSQLNSPAWAHGHAKRFTPTLFVFYGFFERFSSDPKRLRVVTDALIAIQIWLRLLHTSGIDLVEHGQKEKLIHATSKVRLNWSHAGWSQPYFERQDLVYRLISFDYGPKPSDWKFWIMEDMDFGFREF